MEALSQLRLRVSSSIYPFEEKAIKIWGLKKYNQDLNCPLVYFGLYHLNDWRSFMRHKGKRYCVWAGGDIKNLKRGYAFSDGKELWKSKLFSFIPWHWIFRIYKAEHFVENDDEQMKLLDLGIKANIVPTFLEDINEFPVSYKHSHRPQVYISARKGQEKEYGVIDIYSLAHKFKDYTFHIYGIEQYEEFKAKNIIYHGNVKPEQFNKEIKNYQCGLRLNESDGMSEIMVKSILLGQYPITRLKYPLVDNYETDEELVRLLEKLKDKKESNTYTRKYYLDKFNKFPFLRR